MVNLSPATKALWGKKAVHDNQEFWLPLVAHLIDTKNVMQWLYNNWISEGTRKILQQNLSPEDVQKLVGFLGFFHDFGKATPAFQYKQSFPRNKDLDEDITEKLRRAGFSSISMDNYRVRKSPHPIAGEALLESLGLNESIGSIIGGHHGLPPKRDFTSKQLNSYASNLWGRDTDTKIQDEWKSVQNNLFRYGLALCGYDDIKDIPEVTLPQAVILEGMLIMADWLASSEKLTNYSDISLFPLISLEEDFDSVHLKDRYQHAIQNWELSDRWMPEKISSIMEQYRLRFNFVPRPVQKEMSEIISQSTDPGLIIIEAPTGIGKTELALTAAEQLAFKQGKTGLYMGLFSRVKHWLDSMAKEQAAHPDIKLLQGKAKFNKSYTNLPYAENIYDDTDGDVVINSWFAGKKSSLSHFAVGTIDNLLLTALKQKHLFLRHLGFSDKVVIIDELHAYDSYMSSYLEKAIKWLGAYHVPVIALSATLPKKKRNDLLKAYLKGKYGSIKIKANDNWEDNEGYPLLSILDGNKLEQVSDFSIANDENRTINVVRFNGNEEEIINKAVAEIEDGGIAGIVVNTVKRAQDLARLVPENIEVLLLHSAYLAPEREKIEERLQAKIGKGATRPKKMIVIGTQVLEQSLDIDFDVLFTDIAPVDLIIQRIGRLHRHKISRPMHLAKPTVYITGINSYGDYGKGNEFIYEKYLLMKTDHFLTHKINIPNDVSPLVQKVYDPTVDKDIKDIAEAEAKFEKDLKKSKKKAKVFQIENPNKKGKNNLFGWLSDGQINVSDDNHAAACVRDIKETIEVILLKNTSEGTFLMDGRNIEEVSSEEIAGQTIRLPFAVVNNSKSKDPVDKTITKLEKNMLTLRNKWKGDIWLRGALALEFNENNLTTLNGFNLKYSSKLGLMYEKEEEDG